MLEHIRRNVCTSFYMLCKCSHVISKVLDWMGSRTGLRLQPALLQNCILLRNPPLSGADYLDQVCLGRKELQLHVSCKTCRHVGLQGLEFDT